MAATFAYRAAGSGSFNAAKVPGSFFDALIEVTGDASYPTGGYPFGIAQLQALAGGAYSVIESVEVVNPWDNATTSFMAVYIKSTGKVAARAQAVAGAATAQVDVTATTPLTGYVCTLRVRFA